MKPRVRPTVISNAFRIGSYYEWDDVVVPLQIPFLIQEAVVSNIGRDTDYPDLGGGGIHAFPQSLHVDDGIVPQVLTAFLRLLSNLLFIIHPRIRQYAVCILTAG
jgi:hypothetical protein